MIKYESNVDGETNINISGSSKEIGFEAVLMIVMIYDEMYKKNITSAVRFRNIITHLSNKIMDDIERGEFNNDDYTA